MKWRLVINSFVQSIASAIRNFKANKMRTFLSLLGVCIGIFCISGILTLVDSLEENIQQSFAKLGENVFYIQKNAWGGEQNVSARAMANRPEMSLHDLDMLKRRFKEYEAISYSSWIPGQKLSYRQKEIESVTVTPVNHQYVALYPLEFKMGNFFTDRHDLSGSPVAVIGHDVSEALFPAGDALGRYLEFNGQKLRVVGVLEKEGQGLFNFSSDNVLYVPQRFVARTMKITGFNGSIMIKAPEGRDIESFRYDLLGAMRSIRRLKPAQENNFAINQITSITDRVSSFFDTVSMIGWVIALFSILVGGFGIANIMFVTVQERTRIIGTEKALGAPSSYIMTQFLGEAVMLCVMGGLIGMGGMALIALVINSLGSFTLYLTFGNLMTGLLLSSGIGILSGYIPARRAARLDPIIAIRS